jgi:hypothetical protein
MFVKLRNFAVSSIAFVIDDGAWHSCDKDGFPGRCAPPLFFLAREVLIS